MCAYLFAALVPALVQAFPVTEVRGLFAADISQVRVRTALRASVLASSVQCVRLTVFPCPTLAARPGSRVQSSAPC
jgi:hypothetical protein